MSRSTAHGAACGSNAIPALTFTCMQHTHVDCAGNQVKCNTAFLSTPPSRAPLDFRGAANCETRLRIGSEVALEARQLISQTAGYRTSAGVACNKLLAKLVSGLHKPDDQTVMLPRPAAAFVAPLPVQALPGVAVPYTCCGARALLVFCVFPLGSVCAAGCFVWYHANEVLPADSKLL